MATIAVIGDIHGDFTDHDVETFNGSDVDLILIVGDVERIGTSPISSKARVASTLARLNKPTLLIPGNHDGVRLPQLVTEAIGLKRTATIIGFGHSRRIDELEHRLRPVVVCGYSVHHFTFKQASGALDEIDVIACRPYSMGGPSLSFASLLSQRHGVRTIDESAARLCHLVDQCKTDRLVFLAHNGPTGLGVRRGDIWGRDFGSGEGDHGDPDLEIAVTHAKASGLEVIAVVAGHMHHAVKGGGTRPWHLERDGTHYLNAARVPRIFTQAHDGHTVHHHLRLAMTEEGVDAVEHLVLEDEIGHQRRSLRR